MGNKDQLFEKMDLIIEKLNMLLQATISAKPIPSDIQGETQVDVLKLCDLENSPEDMMKKLKKSRTAIDNALLKLRKMDAIKSHNSGNKIVYMRLK